VSGSVVRGAEDTPYGRLAPVADPTGAGFNLSSLENGPLATCSVGNRQCIDFDEKAFTRQAGDHRRARRQHTAG